MHDWPGMSSVSREGSLGGQLGIGGRGQLALQSVHLILQLTQLLRLCGCFHGD